MQENESVRKRIKAVKIMIDDASRVQIEDKITNDSPINDKTMIDIIDRLTEELEERSVEANEGDKQT